MCPCAVLGWTLLSTWTKHSQITSACLQVSHSDGYWTHPALLDAATHFGAVADTDALWRDGVPAAARVPVGLGVYAVALPTSALVRLLAIWTAWPTCTMPQCSWSAPALAVACSMPVCSSTRRRVR